MDTKSNYAAIKGITEKLREADGLSVATADLIDDGGAYNAAWCDTVVTMCNELKADLNAVLVILQGITK